MSGNFREKHKSSGRPLVSEERKAANMLWMLKQKETVKVDPLTTKPEDKFKLAVMPLTEKKRRCEDGTMEANHYMIIKKL